MRILFPKSLFRFEQLLSRVLIKVNYNVINSLLFTYSYFKWLKMGRIALEKNINLDEKRRSEWVALLFPHFMEKGIKNFNMNDACAVVGASKRTLYKVFQSREDILTLMVEQRLSQILEFESVLADESKTFFERYYEAVEILSTALGGVSTIFMADLKKYHPPLWENIELFQHAALAILREFYLGGQKAGAFNGTDINILVLADELFFQNLTNPEFLGETGLSMQEAYSQYFLLKLEGMRRVPKGQV